jgi:serine/threonine protein kinase
LGLALARRGFFNGMMQGLAFCHGLGLHHRDIKLENLMLAKGADGELTVKLADFGLSDLRVLPSDLSGTFCGSPLYAAPELMTTGACPDGYDASRSDIWSCGVVLYALLASCLPFDADDIQALVRMIQEGKPSAPVPRARGDDASALVLSMMQVDPNARPSAAEVLTHAWSVLDTSRPAIKEAATVGTTLPAAGTLELEGQEGGGNSGSNPAESKAGVNAALDDLEPPSPAHRRGASETTAFFKSMRAKEDLRAAKEAATTAAGAEGAEGAAGAGREAGGGAVWDLGAAWAAGAGGEGPRKAGANMTVEEREMIRREREAMKEELT